MCFPAHFISPCNNILQQYLWGGCFFNCWHEDFFSLAGTIFLHRIKIREAAIFQALKDCACSQLILLHLMCVLDIGASELKAILRSFFFFFCLTWANSKQKLFFSLAVALAQAAGWKGLSSVLLSMGIPHVLCQGAAAWLCLCVLQGADWRH